MESSMSNDRPKIPITLTKPSYLVTGAAVPALGVRLALTEPVLPRTGFGPAANSNGRLVGSVVDETLPPDLQDVLGRRLGCGGVDVRIRRRIISFDMK